MCRKLHEDFTGQRLPAHRQCLVEKHVQLSTQSEYNKPRLVIIDIKLHLVKMETVQKIDLIYLLDRLDTASSSNFVRLLVSVRPGSQPHFMLMRVGLGSAKLRSMWWTFWFNIWNNKKFMDLMQSLAELLSCQY